MEGLNYSVALGISLMVYLNQELKYEYAEKWEECF
jgi:hypothetical protein